jgi:uncharacterized membrane-anchored protein
MATLLLLSSPGKRLTYEDGDIILAQDVGPSPGAAVVANEGGDWSFIYITDREPTDPDIQALLAPLTEGDGEDAVQTKKRGCSVSNLPGWPSGAYEHYSDTVEGANAQHVMTWQVFSAKVGHKGGK